MREPARSNGLAVWFDDMQTITFSGIGAGSSPSRHPVWARSWARPPQATNPQRQFAQGGEVPFSKKIGQSLLILINNYKSIVAAENTFVGGPEIGAA